MCEDPGYYYGEQDYKVTVLPTEHAIVNLTSQPISNQAEQLQGTQSELVIPQQ